MRTKPAAGGFTVSSSIASRNLQVAAGRPAQHTELKRYDEAADYYEQALDNNPSMDKAFVGLTACLKAKEDWSALVNAYRAQLERIKSSATPEARAQLWDAIGDVYRTKLDDNAQATDAYQQAQELDPESRERLEMLATIYETNPKKFFKHFFVVNYCPLVFMEGDTGRNRVPEKLPKAEREALFEACDAALVRFAKELKPKYVVGVGKWPMTRAQAALGEGSYEYGYILHPSPANPNANKGWAEKAEAQLAEILGADHAALT